MAHDQVEQRREILARPIQLHIGPAGPARGVHRRKVELLVIGAEVREKVETFVQRPVRLGIGLVDLVQHHDGLQPQRQRLGGHELGLRHRAFGRVHQQHHTIDHRQDTFDLAAEIGVARSVDDIDPRALPFDRGRLGKDGDAPFAFEVIAVHRPFGRRLVFPVGTGLFQKLIHQRRLAMVDVGDDRNIAQVHELYLFSELARHTAPHRRRLGPNAWLRRKTAV